MSVNCAYKYRLEVNDKQKELLFSHIFSHNQTWNILLNEKIKEFEKNSFNKKEYLNITTNNIEDFKYEKLSSVQQDNLVKEILHNRKLNFNTKVTQQCRMNLNEEWYKTLKKLKENNYQYKKTNINLNNKQLSFKPKTILDMIGMLQFKSSKDFNNQSFQTTKEQYSIKDSNNKRYKILKLFRNEFKIRWSRDFPENCDYKTITISYKNGNFYVSFNISYENNSTFNNKNIPENTNKIGMDINIDNLDLGNKDFHKKISLLSIKNDNLEKKYKQKLKVLNRKQSRRIEKCKENKTKLGKNFYKTQKQINKIKEKNSNKKLYNLHQIVNEIINLIKENKCNHLIMENLNVKQMTSKKNVIKKIGKKKSKSMKKNILHISFGIFKDILKYKCANNEIYLSEIEPHYTSKSCSCCNTINNDLNITQRMFKCNECGTEIDRDYNSVLNILNKVPL